MDYSILKYLHESSAFMSLGLFIARGVWMVSAPVQLQQRWVKVVPHVVDSLLFATAIALVWSLGGPELLRTQSWLVAKILAVLVYIVLGSIALKRGRTRKTRVVAFIAEITVFAYIVSVALAKSPWGGVGWLSG